MPDVDKALRLIFRNWMQFDGLLMSLAVIKYARHGKLTVISFQLDSLESE